jgi:phosphohistidine phosphatase
MKTVIVLRHAKSDWSDEALRDFDRGLNERGQRAAAVMGHWSATHDLKFDALSASPAQRVVQTLGWFRDAYGPSPAPAFDMRLYLAAAGTIAEVLGELHPEAETVLLAAHSPGIEDFILNAAGKEAQNGLRADVETKFPTAAIAVLDFDVTHWSEIAERYERRATLKMFVRPRDVDPSLGPDTR